MTLLQYVCFINALSYWFYLWFKKKIEYKRLLKVNKIQTMRGDDVVLEWKGYVYALASVCVCGCVCLCVLSDP